MTRFTQARAVWDVVWTAIKKYFIPIGFLATSIKLQGDLPRPALWVIVACFLAYVFWQVLRDRKRNDTLISTLSQRFESLIRLGLLVNRDREKYNRYSLIERTLYVDRPDAFEVNVEHGMSHADQAHTTRLIASDAPFDPEQTGFEAWIELPGKGERETTWKFDGDANGRRVAVVISFRGAVIRPSDNFRLRWHYRLPGSVSRNEDHWVCGGFLSDYPIGRIILKICFPERPADICLMGGTKDQPISIEGPEAETDKKNRVWQAYRAELAHPEEAFYIWQWKQS